MVDVIGRCVYDTLFSSSIMLDFLYEMMILMSEHEKTGTLGVKGSRGGREGNSDKLLL